MVMRYQPQGLLRIDRNHPLARGLVFAAIPGGPELVSGVMPLRIGGASVGTNEQGRSFSTASNTADGWYWPVPASHPIYSITTADSLFILMKRASSAGFGNVFGIPYRAGAWANPYYAWGLATQSDTTQGAMAVGTGSASRVSVASSAGLYANNAPTRAQGHTRNGSVVRFYAGTAQFGSDAGIGTGSPDWTNKQPPCLFNRGTIGGEGMAAQANVVLVWNRELSAAEWKLISENPWQIFEDASDEDSLISAAPALNTYFLTAAPGSFGLSGSSASLRASRTLAGGNGSFSLIGNAASLRAGRRVTGAAGVITLSGGGAVLAASRRLTMSHGAFALTGASASMAVARLLAAAAGAFTLTAGAAQLVYMSLASGQTIVTGAGQFVLTGSAVTMRVTRRLPAARGSFVLSGGAAVIRCARGMAASSGAFGFAGGPAVLRVARRLSLVPGGFDLTGNPAALGYGSTIEYARAPAGSGYTPKRDEYQVRPAQVGGTRPAAIQRNIR